MTYWHNDGQSDDPVWDFTEQPDKYGYNNNPLWTADPAHSYMHNPCGHWHKGLEYITQSIFVPHSCFQDIDFVLYVDENGVTQVKTLHSMWMDLQPWGWLTMIHDTGGRAFFDALGMREVGIGSIWSVVNWDDKNYQPYENGGPSVGVWNENEMYWLYNVYDDISQPGKVFYRIRIRYLRNNVVTTEDIWSIDTDVTYNFFSNLPFTSILTPNKTIIIPLWYWDDVANREGVKIFRGVNFGETWTEVDVLVNQWDCTYPRICQDINGVMYLSFYRAATSSSYQDLVIYKSTDDGASWSQVFLQATTAYNHGISPFIICDVEGTNLYYADAPWVTTSTLKIYKSTDGGVSFSTLYTFSGTGLSTGGFGVRGSVICFLLVEYDLAPFYSYRLYRSDDSGVSFGVVKDFSDSFGYKQVYDFVHHFRIIGDTWTFTTEEMTYFDKLGYSLSRDNGLTWEWQSAGVGFSEQINFPVAKYTPMESPVWPFTEQPNKWGYLNNPRWQSSSQPPINYDGRESEEPQVWTPYQQGGFSNGEVHKPCGHWHKTATAGGGDAGGGESLPAVYTCGQFKTGNLRYLAKLDYSSGIMIWDLTDGSGIMWDVAADDSGVYVCGTTVDAGTGFTVWSVQKRSHSNGSVIWTHSGPNQNDGAHKLAIDENYVYIIGEDSAGTGGKVECLNKTTGVVAWNYTLDMVSGDRASIGANSTGVYIAYNNGTYGGWTWERLNKNGTQFYIGYYDYALDHYVHSLYVNDDYLFLAGRAYDQVSDYNWAVEARNLGDGSLAWHEEYTTPSYFEYLWDLYADATSVYAVGAYDVGSASRIEKRIDSSGTLNWSDQPTNPDFYSINKHGSNIIMCGNMVSSRLGTVTVRDTSNSVIWISNAPSNAFLYGVTTTET